ncbi:hypothetical protein NAT49_04610 [Larsenimonas suaedae]|nr:hypothetical protein [Larsenimonas suaedae]
MTDIAAARARRGASEATPPKETTVDREKLIAAPGLANDAIDEQINQKIAALKAGSDDTEALRKVLDANAVAA